MPRQQFLGEQIEQAAMTKLRDRERFERDASIIGVKSDYQREIDDNCDQGPNYPRSSCPALSEEGKNPP
jgi:hypothetical protein